MPNPIDLKRNRYSPAPEAAVATPPVQGLPEYPGAFRPLSREDVRALFGISIRTLENWISEGRLRRPASIGGRRFWHPEKFYAELTQMLLQDSDEASARSDGAAVPPSAVAGKGPRPPEPHPAASRSVSRSASRCEAMKRRAVED